MNRSAVSIQQARDIRWRNEKAYFNALEYTSDPLNQATVLRYMECRRPYLSAEHPFWLLGDVKDKTILDVGCGDGTRSVLLALKGAQVTGIDLSASAVEAATTRARVHGVADRVRFLAAPLEEFHPKQKFDVIVGWNILHHLIPELPTLLQELRRLGNADSQYLFYEPVNLSPILRRLRLALPIPISGTPDERPLEPAELKLLSEAFEQTEFTYFGFAVRLFSRFVLQNGPYETSGVIRRRVHEWLGLADNLLIQRLGLNCLASTATLLCRAGR